MSADVISLPKGGGAIGGLGESFSSDQFTGTGQFSVPIAIPAGRHGVQPHLALAYGSGTGNGPFGLGWQLSLPGVSRKTTRGVPRYDDDRDVFVLSGAEDLVPVAGSYPGRVRYRPRTEGLFARIEHVKDGTGDYWEVRGADGGRTRYGTARPDGAPADWRDPAVFADPQAPGHVFGWRITETADPFGNLVRYAYLLDEGQPLLSRISYADYGDRSAPAFLVTVDFEHSARPDPFSAHRAGFALRTALRCDTVRISTHAADGVTRVAHEYRLSYRQAPFNGVSLLAGVTSVGIDGDAVEAMPPLTFDYSAFEPAGRRFQPLTGPGLPAANLSDRTFALVDLRGAGLPDVVELGAVRRYWRNAGGGRFELPRLLAESPPAELGSDGVMLMDADGDGRADLVAAGLSGYHPMTFGGGWSRRSFQRYRVAPAVRLSDPNVRLVDLDGDGLTDVLRSGTRLEAWFNDRDPALAWQRTTSSAGPAAELDLADPRVRLADMTGDGLSDLVLLRSGSIAYWPNLGHGRWGAKVTMRRSPRLPDGFDPRRLLLGDVDGDGAADLVYVADGRVMVWGNMSGNGWTEQPVTVAGTPHVADGDGLQLADVHGTGVSGLLYSHGRGGTAERPRFLDLTGGVKPYLLTGLDNHLGARTTVRYRSSTVDHLRDAADPVTRWRTTLPFPVQVVATVVVTDQISGNRLTTEYEYHHGYWDGEEREFRGFARVERRDAEASGAPTVTKTWFHPGPVAGAEAGDWTELDLRHEYTAVDPPLLSRPAAQVELIAGLPRAARRTALRALSGQVLRTELYALDGADRADRPYVVTESVAGLRQEHPRIFFPFPIASRNTAWERGDEPLTRFVLHAAPNAHGLPTARLDVAVPRGRDPMATGAEPFLATATTIGYATRDDDEVYLVDRVARTTTVEVAPGGLSLPQLRDSVLDPGLDSGLDSAGPVATRVVADVRTFYDGDAYTGLPLGTLGDHGAPTRVESLAFPDTFLDTVFGPDLRPPYLDPTGAPAWTPQYPRQFRDDLPPLAGYVHRTDPDGYYVIVGRHRYDVHDPGRVPRGLKLDSLDPLGNRSGVEHDEHDLLVVASTDPAGLVTTAGHDLRLLRPRAVTDPNGATGSVTFSPAGLVTAQFHRGKDGEGDGTEPGLRTVYDLAAFAERGTPVSVRTVQRLHHDTDTEVDPAHRDDVLVSVQYSDGFGRTVQTRTQTEDTLFGDPTSGGGVLPDDPAAPVLPVRSAGDAVVVSGWQVYDHKGRVIRRYEPFFANGFDYTEPVEGQLGNLVRLFYDPCGRQVRTVNPDGSERRVVIGVPADLADPDTFVGSPWEAYTYDANDNAGRTHPEAAEGYRAHWNTPAGVEVDALGRAVRAVSRLGAGPGGAALVTRSSYDIRGRLLATVDPLGREAFRFTVDLLGRRWRADSLDAGRHVTVPDADGAPIEGRDGRDAIRLTSYDPLRRPVRMWARDDGDGPVTLRQRFEYGDAGTPSQPPAERAAARAHNLLGRAVRHHDEAGLVTVGAADFKGNVTESVRRVIADAPILATYEAAARDGWKVRPFAPDWAPRAGQSQPDRDAELLEPRDYATSNRHDAVNRLVRHILPTDVEGRRRVLTPVYNRSGALDQVRLDDTVFVQRISYDAKGNRTLLAYGNGVLTRYAYEPLTTRLARLRTEHFTPDGDGYRPGGEVLQDQTYAYDLAGNLLGIDDLTPGSGIPGNPDALTVADPILRNLIGTGQALRRRFSYDPLYRLLTATGREQQAPPTGDPWLGLPRGTDATRAQAYTETYGYDELGNLLSLAHAAAGGFTRTFTTAPGGNALARMTIGATGYDYAFDAGGNLVAETGSRRFDWDHAGRLAAFGTATPGAEPSVHAQYLYDATGARVKKLVRRQGGAVEVTHYVDAMFEEHRWAGGANNHVHVSDDQKRIAIVRIGAAHPDDRGPATAFQLGDHLGSSTAVVDAAGDLTNREEFTPYGETSFGSYARKRYRYTGKERDEESGLAYHQARYLMPWLARWASVDPLAARTPEQSPYEYAASNPLALVDPTGLSPDGLTNAQRTLIDNANANADASEQFARENPGGVRQLRHDLIDANSEVADRLLHGRPGGAAQERFEVIQEKLRRAADLNQERGMLEERVRRSFQDGSKGNFRQTPWREVLLSRLLAGRNALWGPRIGGGGGGRRGGGGGPKGGGGGGGAQKAAPAAEPAPSAPEPARSGGGPKAVDPAGVRAKAPGLLRTGGTVVGVLGALGLLDVAHSVLDDLSAHQYGSAAKKVAETAGVSAGFSNPVTFAPTAAYTVARTYHANRDEINDHAAAVGEFLDPVHWITGGHSPIGGVAAAGWAVTESTGRTVGGMATSAWRGVSWAAGKVWDIF
ncbi:SpvB/TcaC N-terminal domain-containing protein [Dactylosporangium siamense]|uniref:Uncharacterized protein n=1 Tax=Dactylosporangium siamense TaxID=685454 RepID=A0A919PTH0_9ACTN|nr:SpvB/TcaC N-terminal domain-containing protein [Dactylosporangium siamense]GIG50550.1 hypothetical protein Dsi01nite_085910 [Dactylosporangium siamense]